MTPTGTLTFTRHDNGLISSAWVGGRRVAIQGELLDMLGERARVGSVVHLHRYNLRLVGLQVAESGMFSDCFIAMRDGWLANLTLWYSDKLMRWSLPLYRWECWLRRRDPKGGDRIAKQSIVGILYRPLL